MPIDLTPVINQFIHNFFYLIPILFVIALFKSPRMKGFFGESLVNVASRITLNKNDYHLIKNVTLPTEDGTTQIDHIIVSKYGVFVVETKNMKGWIFGGPNQKTWTQKIYHTTNKFMNPLHQNAKHVNTLKIELALNSDQIHSVIVFVGESTFKTSMPENVTSGFGYVRFIKSKKIPVLSEEEVQSIISKIQNGRLDPTFKTQREHVKNIKRSFAEKQVDTSCPNCGSSMVLREAKKGPNAGKKFWGCSRFPNCRGIINIQ